MAQLVFIRGTTIVLGMKPIPGVVAITTITIFVQRKCVVFVVEVPQEELQLHPRRFHLPPQTMEVMRKKWLATSENAVVPLSFGHGVTPITTNSTVGAPNPKQTVRLAMLFGVLLLLKQL